VILNESKVSKEDKFMLEKVKYDIGTKVRAKINYMNDPRREVDAVICGIKIDGEKNRIAYKIHMEPLEEDRKMGCTGSTGYIDQYYVLKIYQ